MESDRDSAKASYESMKSKYDILQNGMAAREAKVTAKEGEVGKADAAVKTAEAAVTYRAVADVGSSCYWGIYATGSNGSNIIDNDLPGGGRPSVALSGGQDFKSSRCGKWEKQ